MHIIRKVALKTKHFTLELVLYNDLEIRVINQGQSSEGYCVRYLRNCFLENIYENKRFYMFNAAETLN